jgi:hypothetical protein
MARTRKKAARTRDDDAKTRTDYATTTMWTSPITTKGKPDMQDDLSAPPLQAAACGVVDDEHVRDCSQGRKRVLPEKGRRARMGDDNVAHHDGTARPCP